MSHLRYLTIKNNSKTIYTGWFNLDLYVDKDESGKIKGFSGKFAKYIKGFITINLSMLNNFNNEYTEEPMFRGMINEGKIVDKEAMNDYYGAYYEIWCDNVMILGGALIIDNDKEPNKNEDFNIRISKEKQLFAALLDNNGEFYKESNIDLLLDDREKYTIENLMHEGTFYLSDNYIKKGKISTNELSYEIGNFTIMYKENLKYIVRYGQKGNKIVFQIEDKYGQKYNEMDLKMEEECRQEDNEMVFNMKNKSNSYVFTGDFTQRSCEIQTYRKNLNKNSNSTIHFYEFTGELKSYIGDCLRGFGKIEIKPEILKDERSRNKLKNIAKKIEKHNQSINLNEEVSLDDLIGLDKVKETFKLLESFTKYKKILREKIKGHPVEVETMHMIFKGNPGSGKTTVAYRVANLFYKYGLLPTNKCIIAERSDLVGQYIGQTEEKVSKILEDAKGGVLFIDEAYMLYNDSGNDYGKIALTQIMNAMEMKRGELIVILAGYTDKMEQLLEINEGLPSRIKWYLEFEDYNKDELVKILERFINKGGFIIAEDVLIKVQDIMYNLKVELDNPKINKYRFGNGRGVREFYEFMKVNLANRIVYMDNNTMTEEQITTFSIEDVNYAEKAFEDKLLSERSRLIGFKPN